MKNNTAPSTTKKRIAVFAGSFDPVTLGHVDIVERGLCLFDQIFVAIGQNAEKNSLFSLEERKRMLNATFARYIESGRVVVDSYQGLTVDYASKVEADFLLRGARNTVDFEYERTVAAANRKLTGIDTVVLFARDIHMSLCSSVVRDLLKNGADVSDYIPFEAMDVYCEI